MHFFYLEKKKKEKRKKKKMTEDCLKKHIFPMFELRANKNTSTMYHAKISNSGQSERYETACVYKVQIGALQCLIL